MKITTLPAQQQITKTNIELEVTPSGPSLFFEVYQDTDAEDPRRNIEDEHAAAYIFKSGPRGSEDTGSEIPDNIAVRAFARYRETLENYDALALTRRYMAVFHPEKTYQLGVRSLIGYSQSDWWNVFFAIEDGYGSIDDHAQELAQWLRGDVWVVAPEGAEALGGIYADNEEAAVRLFIEENKNLIESLVAAAAADQDEDPFLAPNFENRGIARWHVPDFGMIVSDRETRSPGIYLYPSRHLETHSEPEPLSVEQATALGTAFTAALRSAIHRYTQGETAS